MKKNILFIILLIMFSFYCNSQALTFSPTIKSSKDLSIKVVSKLWSDYIASLRENLPDSIQKSFWLDQSDDLLKERPPTNFYQVGNLLTFNIRKSSDTIYEIHSMQQIITPEAPNILFIYKVCAVEVNGVYKLLNYFDVKKKTLESYHSENVEFYYPCGFPFDNKEVINVEKIIQKFQFDYNIKKNEKKIICLIGRNLSESNSFMGFDFTVYNSDNKYAGLYFFPRTIITCHQDHIHEFIHALIAPEYPNLLSILDEGIATYYGGIAGVNYVDCLNYLKNYLIDNSIDFSNLSSFNTVNLTEDIFLLNIVGALIIEFVLKNHGISKIIELFSCENYEEIFSKIGVKTKNINIFF